MENLMPLQEASALMKSRHTMQDVSYLESSIRTIPENKALNVTPPAHFKDTKQFSNAIKRLLKKIGLNDLMVVKMASDEKSVFVFLSEETHAIREQRSKQKKGKR